MSKLSKFRTKLKKTLSLPTRICLIFCGSIGHDHRDVFDFGEFEQAIKHSLKVVKNIIIERKRITEKRIKFGTHCIGLISINLSIYHGFRSQNLINTGRFKTLIIIVYGWKCWYSK